MTTENNTAVETEFVVQTASAAMPGSCWGQYARVGVLEVEKGTKPAMISKRAKGVVRIVETWEKLNVGKAGMAGGGRCAYSKALAEAEELAAQLNATK